MKNSPIAALTVSAISVADTAIAANQDRMENDITTPMERKGHPDIP